MRLNEKARAKLQDVLYAEELKTVEALEPEAWNENVFRHLWDMPDHETIIFEITPRGKVSRINKIDFKNYVPVKGAYVLLVESENNERTFKAFKN